MGREMGGRVKNEGTYVQIHVDVQQKPTKFYKAIILQLNNLKKKTVMENQSDQSQNDIVQGKKKDNKDSLEIHLVTEQAVKQQT